MCKVTNLLISGYNALNREIYARGIEASPVERDAMRIEVLNQRNRKLYDLFMNIEGIQRT